MPLDGGTLWHHDVALVGERLGGLAGIGWVGEGHLIVDHGGLGEDLQIELCRLDACGLHPEAAVALEGLEEVGEVRLVDSLHLEEVALHVEEHLGGNGFALYGYAQFEVLLLCHLETPVLYDEGEGGGALELLGIVRDAVRGTRQQGRGEEEEKHHDTCRDGGILDVFAVAAEVYGLVEGDGAELLRLLRDGGLEKFCVGADILILLLQLEEIEELVLHLGEVFAHDASGLLVGDDLPEAVHLGQRQQHIISQHACAGHDIKPEEKSPHGGGEIAKMLHHGHQQEERQQQSEGVECALYHPVLVILADEPIQTAEYGVLLLHGTEITCKDTKKSL